MDDNGLDVLYGLLFLALSMHCLTMLGGWLSRQSRGMERSCHFHGGARVRYDVGLLVFLCQISVDMFASLD